MSIASAIATKQQQVADAYTAVSAKGGTLPATQNLTNLATAIGTISGGGSDTIPNYQIVSGTLSRKTDTYNLSGTEFSSVTSIGNFGLYCAFYGCTGLMGSIDLSSVTSIGNNGLQSAFYGCTGLTGSMDLSSVTSIDSAGLYAAFRGCTGLTSVDLSSVTSVANNGLYYICYGCTGLTGSMDLSSVTSVGTGGFYGSFYNCADLTSVDLSSVTSVAGNGFGFAFQGCKKLQTINFDSLTTTSFSNVNAFASMFNNKTSSEATGGCTVHFPSNLASTVAGLTGYPTFGGNANYITLSFDLPATS